MTGFNFGSAKSLTTSAILLVALLAPAPMLAHVVLVNPQARTSDNDLTQDPCGGKPAGVSTATYTAGTSVEITIDLVVEHRNSLQAVISYDNFATRTELASIPSSGPGIYKMTVPLPLQPSGTAILQVTDGRYVSCADITLSEGAPFEINAGLNDAWFFPGSNGQGFLIIVYPDIKQVFLAWFTYDTERPPDGIEAILGEPGHRWITAQGPYEGDTATLDVYVTSGGVFDSGDPPVGDPEKIGTLTVAWAGCAQGLVSYDIPSLGLMGQVPIQRLANDNVALCEALKSP